MRRQLAQAALAATALATLPLGQQAQALPALAFGCDYHVVRDVVNASSNTWIGAIVADFEGTPTTTGWQLKCWLQGTSPENGGADSSLAVPGSVIDCSSTTALPPSGAGGACVNGPTSFVLDPGKPYYSAAEITWTDGTTYTYQTGAPNNPDTITGGISTDLTGPGEPIIEPEVGKPTKHEPNCNPSGSRTPGYRDVNGNWRTDSRSGKYKCEKY